MEKKIVRDREYYWKMTYNIAGCYFLDEILDKEEISFIGKASDIRYKGMAFGGKDLTDEEKEKLEGIFKKVFNGASV